ncbi:MAG: hypothetical protein K1060chlam1_01007 [Candidatus Anoxychlamydiales bacterium]|nr:hypothetical protein [Candidatus Anoxychlamydiales bacterium]
MSSLSTTAKNIQKLEKKAYEELSPLANKHGIALISSIAFLSLAMVSSMMQWPIIITVSAITICTLSSILTYRFYKILQKKISTIDAEKNALNLQNWNIKRASLFSYYIIEYTYNW